MPTQMRQEHESSQHSRMVPFLPLSRAHFTLPGSLAYALMLTLPVDGAEAIGYKRSHFWDDVARPVCGSALHHSATCQGKRASVNAKARASEQVPCSVSCSHLHLRSPTRRLWRRIVPDLFAGTGAPPYSFSISIIGNSRF